jgi:hypothetical protein
MSLVRGNLRLELCDRFGNVLSVDQGPNLITNVGKAQLAKLIGQLAATFPSYIALGLGNTAANVLDTALVNEITTQGGARATADSIASETVSVTDDTVTFTKVFTFTGSFAIVEAGLLDDPTAGNLFARRVFAAVNVVNGNVLNAIWKLTF